MAGLEGFQLAVLCAALFAGGVVKGLIGMALPVVALGLALTVVEPKVALATMVFPILLSNLWLFVRGGFGGAAAPLKRFWPLVVALVVTLWLTARAAVHFPTLKIMLLLGLVMVGFVGLTLARPNLALPSRWEKPVGVVAGMASGFLGGALAIWGPPIQIYYMSLKLDKSDWMRSIGLIYFLGGIALFAGYAENGMLNRETALMSAAACLPAMIGVQAGLWLQARVDQDTFRKCVLLAIFVLGLDYIRRALF